MLILSVGMLSARLRQAVMQQYWHQNASLCAPSDTFSTSSPLGDVLTPYRPLAGRALYCCEEVRKRDKNISGSFCTKMHHLLLSTAFLLVGVFAAEAAELAVIANDGKQLDRGAAPETRTPDSVAVIDLSQSPMIVGSVAASASLLGPGTSVAIAPDQSFALVAGGRKIDPADSTKIIPDNVLSVIDLKTPSKPTVTQALQAGLAAEGVAINPAGTLALVANNQDGSISVFSIARGKLTPAGVVQLEANSQPATIAFTPDGKTALVVEQGPSKIARLSVNGTNVTNSNADLDPGGTGPYVVAVDAKGKYALALNMAEQPPVTPPGAAPDPQVMAPPGAVPGGRARIGGISVIDLASGKVTSSAQVGSGPEGLAISPDGSYVAVVVTNGSHSPATSPGFDDFGLLEVLQIDGGTITPVAQAHIGHWPQGEVWSKDSKTILVMCATEKDVEFYHFDGKTLTQDEAVTLRFESRPGAMAVSY
jgi:DNA-binding beta-propeller fold protein YncE